MAQDGAPSISRAIIFSAPAGDKALPMRCRLCHGVLSGRISPRICGRRVDFRRSTSVPAVTCSVTHTDALACRGATVVEVLDERENWALMTPEEILGVGTAGSLLRTPEQKATDDKKNLSVFERFLERQQLLHLPVTNGNYGSDSASGWDFSRNQRGLTNGTPSGRVRNGLPGAGRLLDRFFNDPLANRPFAGQDGNQSGGWFSSLGLPPQPAPPTPEQLAERERFRQLLDSSSVSETSAKSAPIGKSLSSLQPFSDTTSDQMPTVNPVGASYAPLSSGIGRPAGLTPLPGITTVPASSQSSAPPAWAPQPPPWLLPTPQRKF